MLDFSAPIYIEYKNFSENSVYSERQKDLINGVLRKIVGPSQMIMERSHIEIENINFENQKIFEVKCIVCTNFQENSMKLVLDSIQKYNINSQNLGFVISFKTVNDLDKIFSWKIQLQEIKPIIVFTGKDVKININSGSGIQIHSSGKALKNATFGEKIKIQVAGWFNNNKNKTEIVEAKVIAPNEVEYVSR